MKKIGEIKGVPVVEGDANLVKNQILYKETDKGISLSKRTNGKLEEVSWGNSDGGNNKLHYYCFDLSKYEEDTFFMLSYLCFLNINSFVLPDYGRGNCILYSGRTESSLLTSKDIIMQLAQLNPEELEYFPFKLFYFCLNNKSEITVDNGNGAVNITATGNVIEQLSSMSMEVSGDPNTFASMFPIFTEITEEEYLAL